MNTLFQVHFSNDNYCDAQSSLHQEAIELNMNIGGSIKMEFLEEAKKIAKEYLANIGGSATVVVFGTKESGRFDPSNVIEEYEI